MKILQICSARSIGGGERHVIDLSNRLTDRGHEVFLAIAPGSPLRGQLTQIPSENISELSLRNALDLKSAFRIGTLAKQNNIELINAHLARDYPIAVVAAKIAKVPLVITRHVLFPMNRLHKRFLRDVKYVIAPSNAVATNLKNERIFSNEKIVTIRYGLDLSKFPNVALAASGQQFPTIGAIGNLDPVKGFDVFVHAAFLVHEKMPDVRFRIVGGDSSPGRVNEAELRNTIGGFGLTDTVEVTGWSSDIAETLSQLDILVSASRSESFGFVIAEAMVCGVPVIATETEGSKEIIRDDSLGIVVPIDSAPDIADAIIELITNKPKRDKLSAAGRAYVREHFSLERMVDETEALYRRVIDSSQT
jgi:glycosyltransferase involved in cell wall biosynthesis